MVCEEGGVHVRIEEGKCVGLGCVRGGEGWVGCMRVCNVKQEYVREGVGRKGWDACVHEEERGI